MNVQDLIAKRARAWEAAKSFLEAHRGENGVLSAEDGETYDRMEKEITDLTKEIDRLNRQAAIEAQLNQPTSAPLSNMPTSTGEKVKKGRASDQYAKDMLTAMRTNFHQVSDILQEGVDADGGYLVPEEWLQPTSRLPASTRSTSREPSRPRHGSKRAEHCSLPTRSSDRRSWMRISSMWQ